MDNLELERKKELLKAIREALASISMEGDSLIDHKNIKDDDIERIYQKILSKEKENGRI